MRLVGSPVTVADPQPVPAETAVCPECGGKLWWQVTTSDGLRDLLIDCEADEEIECEYPGDFGGGTSHQNWQSDWQPVYDAVRKWLTKEGWKSQREEVAK